MKKISSISVPCVVAAIGAILLGCGGGGGENLDYIHRDSFNRADTSGRNLGGDWSIYAPGSTAATQMFISGNQVESRFGDGAIGVVASSTLSGSADYAKRVRVSVKFKVVSPNEVPYSVGGLFMNLQNSTDYASYYFQVNGESIVLSEFDGTTEAGTEIATYSIANDTWYILEMESNGNTLIGRLKSSGGSTLVTLTYDDTPRTYTNGEFGFYNYVTDSVNPRADIPLYFDDFAAAHVL